MNAFKHFKMVALALTALMGYQSAAQAAYINTYFAFNNLGSEIGVLQMTSVTYVGAAGQETFVLPDVIPQFGWVGLPDNGRNPATMRGTTFPENPDATLGSNGGDGATTRLPGGQSVSINWDTTTVPLIPTISIISFTFKNQNLGGATSTATMQTPYLIGLIPGGSSTVPGHMDTEIASFNPNPLLGDIYPFADSMGRIGNPAANATSPDFIAPAQLISFAAAEAPIPAAVWLFGSALGVLGWARRKVAAA